VGLKVVEKREHWSCRRDCTISNRSGSRLANEKSAARVGGECVNRNGPDVGPHDVKLTFISSRTRALDGDPAAAAAAMMATMRLRNAKGDQL